MCDLAGENTDQARWNQQTAECCMCGDFGITEELFRCRICHFRLQHKYCSELYPKSESYEDCNWCLRMININHQKTKETEDGNYKPKSSTAGKYSGTVSGTIKKRSNSLFWNSSNSSQQSAPSVKKKKKKQQFGGNSSPDADADRKEHDPIVNLKVSSRKGTMSKISTTARRHQSVTCINDQELSGQTKSEDIDLSARLLSSTGKSTTTRDDHNTAGRCNGNGNSNGILIISRQNSYRNSMAGRCKVRRYKLLEEVSS